MTLRCQSFAFATITWLCLAAALVLSVSRAAAEEYRLQPGDVIEISVMGLPQLSQRAPVQLDGTISVPLIGPMAVEGSTIKEVRDWIQTAFASRLLTLQAPDGQQISRTVERDEIAASVVQYRPIWVSGDVAKPGELPYQPRMTVRQAIASAGGLRAILGGQGNASTDVVGLENQYVDAWLGLATKAVRVWRLLGELGEAAEFDRASIPPPPVPDETLLRILSLETQVRGVRELDHGREKKFLEDAAQLAREQITSLSEQLEIETQGAEDDQAEYDRAQKLLSQGKLTTSRVVEARRAVLYSATRKLQTSNDLMRARSRLAETERALDKLEDLRHMSILEELQKAEAEMAAERVRLMGIEDRLLLAGTGVPGAVERRMTPDVVAIRRTTDGVAKVKVGYEDDLSPGDVLEVVLSTENASAENSHAAESETWRAARSTN